MNLSVKSALIASILLPFALAVGKVHAENVEVAPMIVNGTNASILDFPSFVSLYIDSQEYDGRYSSGAYCGGTLLNNTHVMTAGHCLSSFDTYDEGAVLFTSAVVGLENENRFLNAEKQRVEAVFFHPNFENNISRLLPNDIVILRLEQAVNDGSAVMRATSAEASLYRSFSASFVALGHGDVATGVSGTSILQRADLFWVTNLTCANNFTNGRFLTDKQICFSGATSISNGLKAGTCQGDSGGPIYWDDNGTFKQVGITSFGPATCGDSSSDVTAAYTEVADYVHWIDSVLAGQEIPTVTVTEQDRLDYLALNGRVIYQGGTISTTEGDGGGGEWSLWLSLGLLSLAVRRRREPQ
ncbi:serine protease [Vibrio sp. SCSIO 43140]|uniref:S1 family peptidase n=1 Tax=Vibrio sp. SCSIO 43140 TaxID=2819100 RepID=UPI0020754DC1|nr:serine protease [Vibrio sp. SCSIO 43140]USD62609.1 serine protease [Vibrio sp. SCSIO 43140]